MEQPTKPAHIRKITRTRIVLALAVGLAADGMQLALGPLAWTPVDAVIDVAAMALVTWLIGFHWLFLPTFVLEAIPFVDDFPTWTACVVAVIAIHRRPTTISTPSEPPIQR